MQVANIKNIYWHLKTDETIVKCLISQICVIDGASDIIDVEKDFRKQIRYSCIPKYENQICERLEGWWYKKAIEQSLLIFFQFIDIQ